MSVRPHNWTAVGLIFTQVSIVDTKFCLKLYKHLTQIPVSFYATLAAAEVQRNANSVCCAECVEARLKYPHFQSSFEIVCDFKIQGQP
jgi:hypothetical protein